jgi:hypothetical protein
MWGEHKDPRLRRQPRSPDEQGKGRVRLVQKGTSLGTVSPTARLPALAGRLRTAPATWTFIAAGALAIGVYFFLPPDPQ